MGACKQLLPLGDRPAVVRALESIVAAGIGEIIVVIGPAGEPVAEAVRPFPVTIVRNHEPGSDMTGSVRAGLRAVSPDAAGLFIALADHPLVEPATYREMLRQHVREPEAILVPVHAGKRGHPPLFPRPLMAEIGRFATLRDLLGAHSDMVRFIDVPDAGVVLDMDTPEDYREVTSLFAARYPSAICTLTE